MKCLESGPLVSNAIDLTAPATHLRTDIDALWETLRREAPVTWHPTVTGQPGFWVVSSHQLALEVYRHNEVYSSARGNVLATLLHGGDSASGKMLAVSDGSRHREIRKTLLRSFSARNLQSLQQRIATAMNDLIAQAAHRETCDFATDVAPKIPLMAICDILRIPESDRQKLFDSASAALASKSENIDDLEARNARNELLMYFWDLLQQRSVERSDEDVIGNLLAMNSGPVGPTRDEVVLNCYSLLLGGDETTRLAMIGIVKAFADHPETWHQLRDGGVESGTAVEELLRWTTAALHSGRTATCDAELGGVQIKKGDIVTVWIRSANFDESVFHRPRELDLTRIENRHLSFAYGAHFCLGAALARIEIAALLNALVEHVRDIALIGVPAPIYSTFLFGFHSLPVKLRPVRDSWSA
jgi:cytochrome P450